MKVEVARVALRENWEKFDAERKLRHGVPDYSDHKLIKTGYAGGTTGAQFAKDAEGKKWLIKEYGGDQDRVATEVLSNAVYNALGTPAPKAGLYPGGQGGAALAYPLVDGSLKHFSQHGDSEMKRALGKHYMTHALVANYDFAGLVDDNVLWKGNSPTHLDQGGSFEYRAQGAPKEYGPVPGEVSSLLTIGQGRKGVTVTKSQMRAQAAHIAKVLTPAKVDELVDSVPFSDIGMRERVRENLKARVRWMGEFAEGKHGLDPHVDIGESVLREDWTSWDEQRHSLVARDMNQVLRDSVRHAQAKKVWMNSRTGHQFHEGDDVHMPGSPTGTGTIVRLVPGAGHPGENAARVRVKAPHGTFDVDPESLRAPDEVHPTNKKPRKPRPVQEAWSPQARIAALRSRHSHEFGRPQKLPRVGKFLDRHATTVDEFDPESQSEHELAGRAELLKPGERLGFKGSDVVVLRDKYGRIDMGYKDADGADDGLVHSFPQSFLGSLTSPKESDLDGGVYWTPVTAAKEAVALHRGRLAKKAFGTEKIPDIRVAYMKGFLKESWQAYDAMRGEDARAHSHLSYAVNTSAGAHAGRLDGQQVVGHLNAAAKALPEGHRAQAHIKAALEAARKGDYKTMMKRCGAAQTRIVAAHGMPEEADMDGKLVEASLEIHLKHGPIHRRHFVSKMTAMGVAKELRAKGHKVILHEGADLQESWGKWDAERGEGALHAHLLGLGSRKKVKFKGSSVRIEKHGPGRYVVSSNKGGRTSTNDPSMAAQSALGMHKRETLQESAQTAALSVTHAPIGKGGKNWVTASKPGNTGQLPAYIQNVRNAIMRGGKSESSATAIAVGRIEDWASGKGGVGPEVKAAAAKAIAEWQAMRGKARAS